MGFGSKKKGDDIDAQKASLFGKSGGGKLSKSPPPSNNPYATAVPANDPYASRSANPYANQASLNDPYARSGSPLTQPPTSSFGSLTLKSEPGVPDQYNGGPQSSRREKSPVPPGGYGGGGGPPPPRYQSAGNYGQTGGYGSDAYGTAAPPQYSRQGGYGGMGRANSQDTVSTDAGRNALFGDAPSRAAQHQAAAQQYGSGGDSSYANSGGYNAGDLSGGYGAAPDRELTAEEQEEEDINATKQEIRFIKQQDVASTRNARRIAEQSEQIGRDTLQRLGAQGERIHNTERNLDLASSQNVLAEEKARELKTLNRSMFAVHVANPFTTQKRQNAADNLALEKNRRERDIREATQAAAYSSQARQDGYQRDLNGNLVGKGAPRKNLADRAKYQFEADSEDEDMENELDDNLSAIHHSAKTLNKLGKAMGDEIRSQNKNIERIEEKAQKVDDGIAVNRSRLDRIK